MKKISVIIPCYNSVKWLPKCFMSLVEQSIGIDNLELIFVNDASTDDGQTWDMLKEMEKAYPESIIIIDLPYNRRQGGARNEGLKYASGEYIAFVDSDDWIEEVLYEKAYLKAKEKDADIVQFNYNYYFDNVGIVCNKNEMKDEYIEIKCADDRKNMLIMEKFTYGCWNKLYKRSMVINANTAFAENVIYEEPLFVYPLLFYANKLVKMSDKLYIYRQNNYGTMRNDMKAVETLFQHTQVQLMVWEFMKNTSYFKEYYEEIKLYFLHTYLYEILDFAKQREITIDYEQYVPLTSRALSEVKDITESPYSAILEKQMPLYKAIAEGLTRQQYIGYIDKI